MAANRTRIKICGITNVEDMRLAVECGADALGFIFVPGTPRFVGDHPEALLAAVQAPPFVTRVAVCDEPSLPALLDDARFDAIQFYSAEWRRADYLRRHYIQAFRIAGAEALGHIEAALRRGKPDALHLDAYSADRLGGSGETFNWELAVEAKERFDLPIILAGGLTPENVGAAVRDVRPYAVDVSSGVEAYPGRKDPVKLRAFCEAVRAADRAQDTGGQD